MKAGAGREARSINQRQNNMKKTVQKDTALVKMLTYVLGIAPGDYGLCPDENGFVNIKELLKALHETEGWRGVRRGMIEDMVNRLAPDDFELAETGIRCLSRTAPRPVWGEEPPAHLYLGLRPKAWAGVSKRGLEANQAGPVMVAASKEWAVRLGSRRSPEPLVITVQSHQAGDQGAVFGKISEELYICDWLPAGCLMGPRVEERPAPKKPPKEKKKEPEPDFNRLPSAEEMPGSFLLTAEDMEKPYKRKGLKKDIQWKKDRRKARREKFQD